MWSQRSIEGRPRMLIVDGSGETSGEGAELCRRLFFALQKRGIHMAASGPIQLGTPESLGSAIDAHGPINVLFILAYGSSGLSAEATSMGAYWTWLKGNPEAPVLLSVCSLRVPDSDASQDILKGDEAVAPLAVVQETAMTPRAAGLFFLKLFTELHMHSKDSITGKMLWFSVAKSKELLKRRRLEGKVGVKC
jgi:hypothetical protein